MPLQPAPTCSEMHAAYEALAVRDHKLAAMGFAQAMQHTTWPRVIECKARATRAQQQRSQAGDYQVVRRLNPSTGTWHSQRVRAPIHVDLISPQPLIQGENP